MLTLVEHRDGVARKQSDEPGRVVLVVTRDEALWRQGQSICAAVGIAANRATDVGPGQWNDAAAVIVGADRAEQVRSAGLPCRPHVYAVCGIDQVPAVSGFSVEFHAGVVVLPEGSATLTTALADLVAPQSVPGQVATVVGATGGLGTSTLAAGLACVAAREGRSVALVDLDSTGGGIDLLLGAERVSGWRWPRLSEARGVLTDLSEHLARVDGVTVLSMGRLTPSADTPDAGAVRSVLAALRRNHDLVIVDGGRGQGDIRASALTWSQAGLLLAPDTVRGLAAARETLRLWKGSPVVPRLVLRRTRSGGVGRGDLEAALGLPVDASLVDDPAVPVAAERGEPPTRSVRSPLTRTCRTLLELLVARPATSVPPSVDAVLGRGVSSAPPLPAPPPLATPPPVTDPVAQARRALSMAAAPASGETPARTNPTRTAPRRAAGGGLVATSRPAGRGAASAPAGQLSWSPSVVTARGLSGGLTRTERAAPVGDDGIRTGHGGLLPARASATAETSVPAVLGDPSDARRGGTANRFRADLDPAPPASGQEEAAVGGARLAVVREPGWVPTVADLDSLRSRLVRLDGPPSPADISAVMREQGWVVSDDTVLRTVELLQRHSVGAGPLEELLREPGVTDVLVNGAQEVYVDRGRGLERADVRFLDDDEVRRLAQRLAAGVGRRLDDASPFVDARLADGTRVHAVLAGVAGSRTCLSLRVPARRSFSLDDCVAAGSLPPEGADILRHVVGRKLAYLVSGGTGSGKTTLLASLLGLVPETERIVIVEDLRELNPVHPHVVRLEGRPANAESSGAVTLSELVRNSLRMRPDRLVVGEVRGAEIADLLAALNTGHEGGCGTVHANSAHDVPARVEALAAMAGMDRAAVHSQLASAIHAVIHVVRGAGGQRRVCGLFVLQRDEASGLVRVQPAVQFPEAGGLVWGAGGHRLQELLA